MVGCSAPPQTTRELPAASLQPKLATTVRIASIDLFNLKRRLERKDIERFADIVKKEQIEVRAVQGISRYPNVKTRIAFVDEFSSKADMRRAFGETVDMSGQQRGNAVFSVYPIHWSNKKEFDVPTAFFKSALQVSIDAGVRDMIIVSARLPEKVAGKDLATCVQTISELRTKIDLPFVVAGNLPAQGKLRSAELFADVQTALPPDAAKTMTSRVWYAPGDLFRLQNARTVKTDLGTVTIAEFGLYQPILPQ